MGNQTDARASVDRDVEARPWTLKLYVASVAASSLLVFLPQSRPKVEWSALLYVVLLLGVWVGSRVAWALVIALYSFSFVVGLVSFGDGSGLILVGLLAVWIGLLVATPTQRWIDQGGPRGSGGRSFAIGKRVGRFVRSEWRTRPLTLRIYVAATLVSVLVPVLLDPSERAFPQILFALVALVLLKMLWNGSAGVWWLSVITYGAAAAVSLAAASEHRGAWVSFAISAAILMLLVHRSTRAWFNERIAEAFP